MKPTAEHLALLRQLPLYVKAMLCAHGPGWERVQSRLAGAVVELWALRPRRSGQRPLDSGEVLWLPCDPTAIGQVAIDLMGGHHTVELETTDDGTTCARMRSTLTDTWTHWRISKDAHTVVLRLLIRVCAGGEE